MLDLKISQFANGGAAQTTDEIATNRGGINTKVFVGSAAGLDYGTDVGDLVRIIDVGGSPGLPALDGSLLTNVSGGGGGSGDVSAAANLTDNAITRGNGGAKGIQTSGVIIDDTDNVTGMATLTLPNTGLHILDTNATHDLIIVPGTNLTADRTLTIITGDANRSLTLTGNFSGTGTNTGDQTTAGTTNRITVTNGATSPTIDIASTYVGQASITTLGTITTGVWNGTVVGPDYIRHLTASASVASGTHTVNIANGDFHTLTATGIFTLAFSMQNGQAVIVRGINFNTYTPIDSLDWGATGEPVWTGKDDFVVYRDGAGNYIGALVAGGLA